ncbi:hypothetical protein SBRCBS47491_001194 [Sporothrix bragantina]|uniref:DUF7735 domain-containing protein n=1 Tax=Sporothrix bragantina TaxID=671064 RepID=A0ABP0AWK5_9PEZI
MAPSLLTATAAVLTLGMAATSMAASLITAAPASTDIAGALSTLLPTAPPTSTEDFSVSSVASLCQSDLFIAVFLKATPTGDFASALSSFGSALTSQECGSATAAATAAATVSATITAAPECTPAPSLWCAFPSIAPSSVLSDYSSYAMRAASYFPSGLSPLVTLAQDCPQAWYEAKTMISQGPENFRTFAMLGECFADVRQADATATISSSGSGSAATATATTTTTATGSINATTNGTATAGKPGATSGVDKLTLGTMALSFVVMTCSVWAFSL